MGKNKPINVKKIALIAVFLLCIFLPGLPLLPSTPWNNDEENRSPAPAPSLVLATLEAYPAGFEAWYNDAFALRGTLLDIYKGIKWRLADSVASNTLQGKNGWIYYEPTVVDYKNYTVLTQADKDLLAEALGYVQQLAGEYDAAFYMFTGPNKNEIYPEFMPERIRRNQQADTLGEMERFITEELGIAYIPVRQTLVEAKDNYAELYYPQGTHWNTIAAYLAYQEVFTRIQQDFPSLCVLRPNEVEEVESQVYLGPNPAAKQLRYWRDVSRAMEMEWAPRPGAVEPGNAGNGLTMLVLHDSFWIAMHDYTAGAADVMVYGYNDQLSRALLEEVQPDIIILEIVQRDVMARAHYYHSRLEGTGSEG